MKAVSFRRHIGISLCLLIAIGSASCAGPVLTQESFNGRCRMYSPGGMEVNDFCAAQVDMCSDFSGIIYDEQPSRQACIHKCTELKGKYYRQFMFGACRDAADYAWRTCSNYCRALYPESSESSE